ncbi:MAG: oxidoreductase [Patescibacteria group bacterium]|nr:RnfABCDGE type electron transport complex subunit D [Patescibacteria group bacterium]
MIRIVDNYLNKTTMYRLVLYYLICLVSIALVFSFFHILPFSPINLLLSTTFLIAVTWATNTLFAKVFEVGTNVESVYITALILALIITPVSPATNFALLLWAAVLSMASKYIVAINKKHIFNPAAFAVVVTAFTLGQSASWWIGTKVMLPFVVLGGLLVIRKIKRLDLVWSFFLAILLTLLGLGIFSGLDLINTTKQLILLSPLFFFAFVMLVEPLTTPPTKKLQMIYGFLVGFLFVPQIHVGSFYFTPEIALLIGNVYVFFVSPKVRLHLKLTEKFQLASDVYDFRFQHSQKFSFTSGQYLEWTLPHNKPDNRGNRRYLTIASSPTEEDIMVGVKFYENSSSFKKKLLSLPVGEEIFAGQLSGDFVLPKNPSEKLIFMAGGIGITPFRSMLKSLIDINQQREITLIYSNKSENEIVYKDVIKDAENKIGLKTVFVLTDKKAIRKGWEGWSGRVNKELIKSSVPDYKNSKFYISGPKSFVDGSKLILKNLGVSRKRIITDYFPGFV